MNKCFTIKDIAMETEFDCYCCQIPCDTVGCACDYECDNCPDRIKKSCSRIGTWCRPVYFSIMSYYMIIDGMNYEVSADYLKISKPKSRPVIIPF